MTSRQARRERRAAERKIKKAEKKQNKAPVSGFVSQIAPNTVPANAVPTGSPAPEIGFVSQNHPAPTNRAAINRANAQLSTGPRTSAGKASSSRNATKHGLASGQLIIFGEDPAVFESLLADLLSDHLRLQNNCFTENGVDQKGLSLFLRYGATHHRAFYKALADLQRLQKERKRQENGFVSQSASNAAPAIGFVSQNEPSTDPKPGFVSQTAPVNSLERRHNTSQAA